MAETGAALVTGGSGGIGRAVAARLLGRGHAVALLARDERRLEEARAALDGGGGRVRTFPCDVRDAAAVKAAVDAVAEALGRIDVLVTAAGVAPSDLVSRLRPGTFEETLRTNVLGVVNACRAVLAPMRRARGGRIVIVGSRAGWDGPVGFASYSASEGALRAFSRSLGREASRFGVNVSLVAPDRVATRLQGEDAPRDRLLAPDDVAAAVSFLLELSPQAAVHELRLDLGDAAADA